MNRPVADNLNSFHLRIVLHKVGLASPTLSNLHDEVHPPHYIRDVVGIRQIDQTVGFDACRTTALQRYISIAIQVEIFA